MTKSEIVERVDYAFNALLEARNYLQSERVKQYSDPNGPPTLIARAIAKLYYIEDVLNPIVESEKK